MREVHKKFIEEDEASGTFHIIAVKGSRGLRWGEETLVWRVVLREMRCLSWDEERYEINHGVDEGTDTNASP